ncbi:MAG: 50S ribosomal protein L35 [Candidatus Omnitrophota bacterium]
MPKLKTNKGTAKRFKLNKKGRARRQMAGKSHILTKKSRKRKRNMRRVTGLAGWGDKLIRKLMPYG